MENYDQGDKKWELVHDTSLRKFRVVDVREKTWRLSETGNQRSYVVCDSADWVLVIPVTPDGNIVFVRQFRHGLGKRVLEIPGGVMDPGELPEETAVRELQEETGYVPRSVQIFGPLLPNPALNNARIHVAVARGCLLETEPSPEPFEDIEVSLRPLSDVAEMVRDGELQHALCIAAFTLTRMLPSHMSATNQCASPPRNPHGFREPL